MADALDLAIAQGPGRVDFSPIGSLPDAYWKGREEAQKQQQRDVFKGGVPTLPDGSPDYAAMSKALYQIGDVGQGNALSDLDIKRQGLRLGAQAGDLISGTGPGAFPPSTSSNGLATKPPTPNSVAAPPVGNPGAGDTGNTPVGLVSRYVTDPDEQGKVVAQIAAAGVDPNIDLSDPATRARVMPIVRQALGPRAAQAAPSEPTPGPQAPVQPGSPASLPPGPASGIVPQGQDPLTEASRFEQAATMLTAQAARMGQLNPQGAAQLQARAKALNDKATEIRGAITKYNEAYTGEEATRFGKKYDAVVNAGNLASESLPQMQVATNLMNDPHFYSGVGESLNLFYKRLLPVLGGDQAAADPQEAFRKVVSNGLLDQIKGLSGSGAGQIRVAEIKIMQQAAASPDNTPWGNRTLLEMSSRVAQRNMEIAHMAENYNNGRLDPGFDRSVRQYDKAHPLFTDQEIQNPRLLGAPTVTPDQAKKLPANVPVIRTTDGRYVYRQQ